MRRVDEQPACAYHLVMNFGILFEKIQDKDFPAGYFYAHVPSLGLTRHGLGIEGARQAAFDLARLWFAEKKARRPKKTTSRPARIQDLSRASF
jgi:hypothetical protein